MAANKQQQQQQQQQHQQQRQGAASSPFQANYSLFPATSGPGSRRTATQPRPYPYRLRPHPEEQDAAEPSNDAGDDADGQTLKTNSTVSLVQHHYRSPASPDGHDHDPEHEHSAQSDRQWGKAKASLAPTPPRSPDHDNWPLPVSPKTVFPPLSTPEEFPLGIEQADAHSATRYYYDSDEEFNAREQEFPLQRSRDTGAVEWQLPPAALSTSPQSVSGIGVATSSPTPTFPFRSHSFAQRPSLRSGSSSTVDIPEYHPGTLVDPSQIDEDCHTPRVSRPDTSASTYSASSNNFAPVRKISLPAGRREAHQYFPLTSNQWAGFCKGAWRLQTKNAEKAFSRRVVSPRELTGDGVSEKSRRDSKVTLLKCKKCSFEGSVADVDPENAGPQAPASLAPIVDYVWRGDRTPRSAHGVTYNWGFLFKCHIPSKAVLKKDEFLDPATQTFGCLFCCAEGNSTVCFETAQTLCGHISRHHHSGVAAGPGQTELNRRLTILIGRAPNKGEDWDIMLPGHYSTYHKREPERALSSPSVM